MDRHRPINKLRLRKLIEDHSIATLEFSDDTLLVFIDEVGIGNIDEHHHPLFGMGGCANHGEAVSRDHKELVA